MSQVEKSMAFYERQLKETKKLGFFDVIKGFLISTAIMAGTTFGLLVIFFIFNVGSLTISIILPLTVLLVGGAYAATVLSLLICLIIIKYPKSIALVLKIHSKLKHGSGEYFLCPDAEDQDLRTVIRRALYGSVLVVGIALTVISFDLLVVSDPQGIQNFGLNVTLVSLIILPFIVMLFFFAPWLIKDSGLFHLDIRDRSLSNVGDDLEDVLEFVAGVDLLLVWFELATTSAQAGLQYIWMPIVVIIVALGPLFSIMINFTLVFMFFKDRATLGMIEMILTDYKVPEMVDSSDHIRSRVLGLVERRMLVEEAVEVFESQAPSGTDLMSTMMDGMEEIEEKRTEELPTSEEFERSIQDKRAELVSEFESPEELIVTSLKAVDTSDEVKDSDEDDSDN